MSGDIVQNERNLKIVFLIQELKQNAGQTNALLVIIHALHRAMPNLETTIMTHSYDNMAMPDFICVKLLRRYYSCIFLNKHLSTILAKFDLIYIKGQYPYVFPALRSGRPTVLVIHHLDSPRTMGGLVRKTKALLTIILTPLVITKPVKLVTVSEESHNFYKARYGAKSTVIEDQIDEVFYGKVQRDHLSHRYVINLLSVGYWDGLNGRKRQHLLFDFLNKAGLSDINLKLTLVGLSDKNIRDLQSILHKKQIGFKVDLKGILSKEDLAEAYRNNDIYVTATTYEAFYRPVVEAFASGMPALVYDSRAFTKEIQNAASAVHVIKSEAGQLFMDITSFADGLKKILDNYSNMSRKAYEYALRFQAGLINEKNMHLLKEMLTDL